MNKRSRLYADFAAVRRRRSRLALLGPVTRAGPPRRGGFAVFLPSAYRQFLTSHGPLFVPELCDNVIERELPARPPREFLTPFQVVADTRVCWVGGMPNDFIGIATDFTGDMFGFRR